MPQARLALPFQVDHIIARQHRGRSTISNLAWACAFCNAHKGPNLSGIDPKTRKVVPLFNPRGEQWNSHFRWFGARVIGVTATGRATIDVLAMNNPISLIVRTYLLEEGVFHGKN